MSVVTLDYNDLIADVDLSNLIEQVSELLLIGSVLRQLSADIHITDRQAYGHDGLGVLTVKNVPEWLEHRQRLLPLAQQFASLPEDTLKKYEHEASHYSFGWSHGKENLQGVPDYAKGSFYANPQYDRPSDDESLIEKYPAFLHANIWPTEDLPQLEEAFKKLGGIIVDVGALVARQCDRYAHRVNASYDPKRLETVIRTSKCAKARLLHYFSTSSTVSSLDSTRPHDDDFSSWCGWHNDHGSLTGLCSAMFLDADGKEIENTDPNAGDKILYSCNNLWC